MAVENNHTLFRIKIKYFLLQPLLLAHPVFLILTAGLADPLSMAS